MADFSGNGYGIAGGKNTSPTSKAPSPTTTGSVQPVVGWEQAWRMRNVDPSQMGRGTPMRPVPGPAEVASRIPTRGTPMRPVPARPSSPLVYFGGTPTSSTGYVPRPTYFGGTPTSDLGYSSPPITDANNPNQFDAERKRRAEEDRKRREEEAARTAELEKLFSELPALLPEQQQAYRQSVRDAEREFEMIRNQVQLGRQGARRDFRQGVREVNRQQTGGSQDLATALAYLGMDTSPATMGVGLQSIESEADLARAELARVRAMTMGDLDAQMTQARIGRNRQLSAAEQARLAARAQRATDLERYRMELFGQ